MVTNRALVTMQYVARAVLLSALVAGLLWGFIVRVIDGEAYLGFLALILTFLREMHLPYLDEAPTVHFPPAAPR